MRKNQTINITPYNLKVSVTSTGFTLSFTADIPSRNDGSTKTVKIHLKNYAVAWVANKLWEVQKHQQSIADHSKESLRGDHNG